MNILNKLIKSFSENISKEDELQLTAWKEDSEANLQAIEEFTKLHHAADKLKDFEKFDTSNAWKSIESKIDFEESKKVLPITIILRSIAAIFLLGFATYFILENRNENPQFQTYNTTESSKDLTLDDGTKILLDTKSSLSIIENRYVELSGRAHFNVNTTPEIDNFTIKINKGRITVLGTQFTILSTEDLLEINVIEGHVKVDYDGRSLDLFTNDILKSYDNQLVVTPDNYKNTDSWSHKSLIFDNDPLPKVLHDASTHFKQKIIIDKSIQNAHSCYFTSTFTNPKIEDLLTELKTIFKAKIIKQANSYVIVSINC